MAAEELTRPVRPSPTSRLSAPFVWLDWACQWIAYLASSLAVFRVLEYAGKLTVLVALITWLADSSERQKTAIRTAWSVVNTKGGGRKDGLEYLVNQKVDLKGFYAGTGYFAGVVLNGFDLRWSDLEDANFEDAKLSSADLEGSNLSGVNFRNADLSKADFRYSNFYPKAPNFEKADISGADFRYAKISGLEEYRALLGALNWQKASFDEDVRKTLECVARGDSTLHPECKVSVPDIQYKDRVEDQRFVQAALINITCELRGAVNDVRKAYPAGMFLDSWGVQTTLTLNSNEQGSTVIGNATRTETINEYHLVSDFAGGSCSQAARPDDEYILLSDLKLSEWLFSAVGASLTNAVNTKAAAVSNNILQHVVRFVVRTNVPPAKGWRLTRVTNDQDKSSALVAGRTITHNLLITFGPVAKDFSSQTANVGSRAIPGPTRQAADLHLSSLTSLSFETALRSSTQP
jgi:hypothetical protein